MAYLTTQERHNAQTLSQGSDQIADSGVSGLGIADPETIDGSNSAMLIVGGRCGRNPFGHHFSGNHWTRRLIMRFQDFFVPRWQHSNPDVRQKATMRLNDPTLLRQIIEKDDDEMVRLAAQERLAALTHEKVMVDA
jgi:hypothetical protein